MDTTILIVEDDRGFSGFLTQSLEGSGYIVYSAFTGSEGLKLINSVNPDLVLLDLMLPDMSGMDLLREVNEMYERPQVVMMTAHGTIETAIDSMKLGAGDYLIKPIIEDELLIAIKKNLKHLELLREIEYLKEVDRKKYKFNYLVGRSQKMWEIYRLALFVAGSDTATVLIEGESGTGKEYLARFIHYRSRRRDEPFVEINCAAIPENLIETELFGYEPGAFTDARVRKKGQVELASGGTVFLDEIGEMSVQLQAKLLRFLDTMTYKRVGGTMDIKLDVRVIAATNKDLALAVTKNEFRKDLYYRLKVMHLVLPTLRERKEDIELFVAAFLEEFSKKLKKRVSGISEEAMEKIIGYSWNGNIRELRNVLERAVIVSDGPQISARHLAIESVKKSSDDYIIPAVIPEDGIDFNETIDKVSSEMILKALKQTGGNKSRASRLLKIPRQVLLYQMKKLGLR
ncbi:MAG: sigma-54-dependent Fis family transcriptional regulator [Deltaproteobacteria bacterium]|uniref:Sigma-54-dependent Fis family transcriptional regulator n=1 Tax=Candidatus Zymogenus saltonus TaxID=2844893 RepID=A0A9D8KE44_9DELT|nr:sigma-54-dependent Fis family transcriptional regulator [Candidatus Zymogenus saltonus]